MNGWDGIMPQLKSYQCSYPQRIHSSDACMNWARCPIMASNWRRRGPRPMVCFSFLHIDIIFMYRPLEILREQWNNVITSAVSWLAQLLKLRWIDYCNMRHALQSNLWYRLIGGTREEKVQTRTNNDAFLDVLVAETQKCCLNLFNGRFSQNESCEICSQIQNWISGWWHFFF